MKLFFRYALAAMLMCWTAVSTYAQKADQPTAISDEFNPNSFEYRLVVKFDPHRFQVRLNQGSLTFNGQEAPSEILNWLNANNGTLEYALGISYEAAEKWEQEAIAGKNDPDYHPGLCNIYHLDFPNTTTHKELEVLARDFEKLGYLEYFDLMPQKVPPPADIPPVTPLLVANQGYHNPDPGIDMDYAWSLGIDGAGVEVNDCEYDVNEAHEDLVDGAIYIPPTLIPSGAWEDHGTAVAGEIYGQDNAYGIKGGAYNLDNYGFYSEWPTTGYNRPQAISMAITDAGVGDVVVLEMQTGINENGQSGYGPAEYNTTVWNLCDAGNAAGKIIVAAAGNGNVNLDLVPSYIAQGHSGAIIVGAGSNNTTHSKLGFSTYGSRVDLQGWGTGVFTVGYGGFATYGGDYNQRYTSTFNGTSSATPIVTNAVVACQSYAKNTLGLTLTATQIRDALVATGIPQGGTLTTPIGPLPDLGAAIPHLNSTYGVQQIGEKGRIKVKTLNPGDWRTVNLSQNYQNPVVVVGPPTEYDGEPVTIRVRNVTSNSFDVQVDEWDYLDGIHDTETMGYIVMEAGRWKLEGGHVAVARNIKVNHTFINYNYPAGSFSSQPVLLSQCITNYDPTAVNTRHRNAGPTGFEIRVQEQEANNPVHNTELASYIAFEQGVHVGPNNTYEFGYISSAFDENYYYHTWALAGLLTYTPVFVCKTYTYQDDDPMYLRKAKLNQNGTYVRIQEEQSADLEVNHAQEKATYALFKDWGPIVGTSFKQDGDAAPMASLSDDYKIKVWPNPTQNILRVYVQHQQENLGNIRARLMDLSGRVIEDKTWGETSGINTSLDLSTLPQGMYLLHLSVDGNTLRTEKVLKN